MPQFNESLSSEEYEIKSSFCFIKTEKFSLK